MNSSKKTPVDTKVNLYTLVTIAVKLKLDRNIYLNLSAIVDAIYNMTLEEAAQHKNLKDSLQHIAEYFDKCIKSKHSRKINDEVIPSLNQIVNADAGFNAITEAVYNIYQKLDFTITLPENSNPNPDKEKINSTAFFSDRDGSLDGGVYQYDQQKAKHIYYERAPQIKYLVISGGGAKGASLPGVVRAFEKHYQDSTMTQSFMEGFECMVGSSVGAMMAGLLASGISSAELAKAANSAGGKSLLGVGTLNAFHFDGNPLTDFIRNNMWASIRARLYDKYHIENTNENIGQLINCLQSEKNSDSLLLHPIINYLNDENNKGKISFELLHYLHELAPTHFKNLIVTGMYNGTKEEEGRTFYFSYENTPNLDAVIACRASAALPKIINPVEIYVDDLKGGKLELEGMLPSDDILVFSDGGYLDNVPVSCIENVSPLEILAIVFDDTSPVLGQSPMLNAKNPPNSIFNASIKDRILRNWIPKHGRTAIHTTEKNTDKKLETLELIRTDYTQRVLLLSSDLRTTDFDKAAQSAEKYQTQGEEIASEFLRNHEDEFVCYYEADSKDELIDTVLLNRSRQESELQQAKVELQSAQNEQNGFLDRHPWIIPAAGILIGLAVVAIIALILTFPPSAAVAAGILGAGAAVGAAFGLSAASTAATAVGFAVVGAAIVVASAALTIGACALWRYLSGNETDEKKTRIEQKRYEHYQPMSHQTKDTTQDLLGNPFYIDIDANFNKNADSQTVKNKSTDFGNKELRHSQKFYAHEPLDVKIPPNKKETTQDLGENPFFIDIKW